MASTTLTIELTQELSDALADASSEMVVELLELGLRERRIDRALRRFAEGHISFGAAAEMAQLSHSDFSRHAYAFGLQPLTGRQMMAEEVGENI